MKKRAKEVTSFSSERPRDVASSIKSRERRSLSIHICVVLVPTCNCKCQGQSHGNCARG